jgi:hypothetical protein
VTVTPRRLDIVALWSQPRAIRNVAQASHAFDLATSATDAASGRVGQRATIGRVSSGAYPLWWHPVTTARFLEVTFGVGWWGTWAAPDGATVQLAITDGTTTVSGTAGEIPRVLQGTTYPAHQPGVLALRTDAVGTIRAHLDRTALIAAGLSASLPWRLTFTVVCASTVRVEHITVREVPRFAVDSAEAYGVTPTTYQPRGIITTALSRVLATTEAAYDLGRRTYLSHTLPEASPDTVTAAAWAAIPGSQTDSGSTAIAWQVRPRRIRGAPRVFFGVRYKTTSAAGGDIRITTAQGTYTLALAGTSGAWADNLSGSALLADATSDTITWEAQVSAGQLKIAAYIVLDDPAL